MTPLARLRSRCKDLAWRDADRVNLLPVEMRPSRRRWRYAPTYALIAVNVLLLARVCGA